MKDWRYYLTKEMVIQHKCNFCGLVFPTFEEGQKHILDNHEVEIELFNCEVCGEIGIKVIDEQKRCPKRECMFPELNKLKFPPEVKHDEK